MLALKRSLGDITYINPKHVTRVDLINGGPAVVIYLADGQEPIRYTFTTQAEAREFIDKC